MPRHKEIKNIAASVKERLLNISRTANIDYQVLFKHFVQERLLYRIAQSNYADHFLLKGALLFVAHDISRLRPTKDIDLLCRGIENELEIIHQVFQKITDIDCNDGLRFDKSSIIIERIISAEIEKGVRIKITVELGSAKDCIQIDVGFGDKIFDGPVKLFYPTLLNFPEPVVWAYSKESAIAEKFEALVSIGIATSRMKDIYDILFFAESGSFISHDLRKAINLTFDYRNTDLNLRYFIFDDSFKNDKQKQIQWENFIKKNNLKSHSKIKTAVEKLECFINPIFDFKENRQWNNKIWNWECE